jgi:hypothetical protein
MFKEQDPQRESNNEAEIAKLLSERGVFRIESISPPFSDKGGAQLVRAYDEDDAFHAFLVNIEEGTITEMEGIERPKN